MCFLMGIPTRANRKLQRKRSTSQFSGPNISHPSTFKVADRGDNTLMPIPDFIFIFLPLWVSGCWVIGVESNRESGRKCFLFFSL